MLIHNENIYVIQPNLTYKKNKTKIDFILQTYTTQLLEESFKNLSTDQQLQMKEDYKKIFKSAMNNKSGIDLYKSQLYIELQNDDIKFDETPLEIHFNNGYMNLETMEWSHPELRFSFYFIFFYFFYYILIII
jgi:hypothetical protein